MKKTLIVIILALFIGSLFSVEISGEFRTRFSWIENWF